MISRSRSAVVRALLACTLIAAGVQADERSAPQPRASSPLITDAAPDYSSWAVDATKPGAHLPAVGRSLFDYLVTQQVGSERVYRVPFPFSALVERVHQELAHTEFGGGTRTAMIPMGRSLQRSAAAPDFFKYPRFVFAVTGEPKAGEGHVGMLLKDRLYIGYVESTHTLEVISYNEAAGRFEFQLVKDYRAGATPKVYYANRAICISCHQNHAPIFSRAVWSESNANGRVADLLAQARSDFYNLPPQANLDFPDDIGQSSVRANALVTHQSLWQRGCEIEGDLAQSRRCRATALSALLQYALSGEIDLSAGAPRYHSDFVATFGANWRRHWPQGLNVAQAELPDRSPFGGSATYGGVGGAADSVTDFIAASNVSAELDPLAPRAPRETWRFSNALDGYRYIVGWSRFFAPADFRALDARLLQSAAAAGVQAQSYTAACKLTPNQHSSYALKIDCDSEDAPALTLRGKLTAWGSGPVDLLNFGAAGQVREAQLGASEPRQVGGDYVLPAQLQRKAWTARLADGRAIIDVTLRWPVAAGKELKSGMPVQLTLRVVSDFALLRNAVDQLLLEHPALFDNAPLRRTAVLRALHAKLGMQAQAWCCTDDAHMPPVVMEPMPAEARMTAPLQPFYQHCATCHLTPERFPPNFLAGNAERVAENLRHCAPRMLVRLTQWHEPLTARAKTPMPPPTYLASLDMTPVQWSQSDELRHLREYVEDILKSQGQPTDPKELLKQGYEALPGCLADERAPHAAQKESRSE